MESLNIIFGLVTLAAFIFSLYQHFSNKVKVVIEEAKVRSQHQRIRTATHAAVAAAEAANAIVQRSKEKSCTNEELRTLGRVVRGQLMLLVQHMEDEDRALNNWQYGQMVASPPVLKKPGAMPAGDQPSPELEKDTPSIAPAEAPNPAPGTR